VGDFIGMYNILSLYPWQLWGVLWSNCDPAFSPELDRDVASTDRNITGILDMEYYFSMLMYIFCTKPV